MIIQDREDLIMKENILLDKKGTTAIVTINRPEVRNALNRETWHALRDTLRNLEQDEETRVIIVTGAGEKAFVAGADLNELRDRTVIETLNGENSCILREIELMTKPIIAAVNGYALGGGCELAIACDLRIASENAKFGQTEINVGILPGAGGTQRLTRLVGFGKAMELILTGEIISAQEAERIGLVNKVVPNENLLEEALKLADKISSKSSIITRLAKTAVKAGAETDFNTSLLIEILCQSIAFGTDDHLEGINAFLEKRTPNYSGK